MTNSPSKDFNSWKRVERFEEAVRDHAFIGTQTEYALNVEAIEKEYKASKDNLLRWIDKLIKQRDDANDALRYYLTRGAE